jgi:hypothetical protein
MPELSLMEIVKYAVDSLVTSKVFVLLILELSILVIAFVFRRLMNKKIVNRTSTLASLVVFGFYISNYYETLITFINNVSTRLVEIIYFPTTLEFMAIMIISFMIMIVTCLKKKSHWLLKGINTILPITISFLFLCIIEYINEYQVPFDEFSVFTNPILMSLYELAMGLFATWIIGLAVYKIDKIIINGLNPVNETVVDNKDSQLITVNLEEENKNLEDDIELPRLKQI